MIGPHISTRKLNERIRAAIQHVIKAPEHIDPTESAALGKAKRQEVPRKVQGVFEPSEQRPDPVALLKEQGTRRIQDLLPLRYERMGVSAFTFYRGAALIMAQDLSTLPTTGIEVQLCGDAHVSNFGLFESPERRLVFDLNDFDETARGPWEWDVKRLVASLEICGRDRGFDEDVTHDIVAEAARAYREAMRSFATMGNMEVFYAHIDVDNLSARFKQEFNPEGTISHSDIKTLEKTVRKAKAKDSARAIVKLTEVVDGQTRIISNPPTIVPIRDYPEEAITFAKHFGVDNIPDAVHKILTEYRLTLEPARRHLVEQYRGVDIAHKVVGVGSVGTRAWIVVMEGASPSDPLVLQIKEAQESVIERFCGSAHQREHGKRVVEGQRAIQAASDPLLGWCRLPDVTGGTRDYYVRQLWDGKGSADLNTISPTGLRLLASACGWTLASAHARTGDRFAIASYLGKKDSFDRAMVSFATAYANQNEADYQRFIAARDAGELAV